MDSPGWFRTPLKRTEGPVVGLESDQGCVRFAGLIGQSETLILIELFCIEAKTIASMRSRLLGSLHTDQCAYTGDQSIFANF